MNINLLNLVLVGAVVGAASGYLGSFMVLKRMSLVGDALSHVALPGIALGITLGVNPMLGALLALLIATISIWYIGEKSDIYPEALVGVFFTASLALGLLLTPEPELLEALFGNIDYITYTDSLMTVAIAFFAIFLTRKISKKLILGIISEDLARSQKINVGIINLIYLLLVSLVVALGIKFLGTLLTGAMVIIPAVTARNFCGNSRMFQLLSIIFGVTSSLVGICTAGYFSIPSGPAIVLTGVLMFIISFAFKR